MDLRHLDNQWFALQVKSKFEQSCARILRFKGYEEFLPLCRFASARKNTKTYKDTGPEPLFPGYLFCKLNANSNGLVLTTPGVIRIVGYGRIPSAISNEEIAAVQCFVESARPVYPWPYLRAGERVRLTAGPFCGVEGILLRFKNANRLVVSISLLQRSASVEIDADWVAHGNQAIAVNPTDQVSRQGNHKFVLEDKSSSLG